jgi:hypothetical protein
MRCIEKAGSFFIWQTVIRFFKRISFTAIDIFSKKIPLGKLALAKRN